MDGADGRAHGGGHGGFRDVGGDLLAAPYEFYWK
jgi:hypothetical protein